LEEDGVIEYDSTAKTVQRGPQFENVYQYVDGGQAPDHRLLGGHLALCVLGLALIVLSGLSLPIGIDPLFSSVLVLLAVAVSSLYWLLQ
ncbi:MAG: DUF7344 domain-containing protein, partial [Halobacteriota archaeon]